MPPGVGIVYPLCLTTIVGGWLPERFCELPGLPEDFDFEPGEVDELVLEGLPLGPDVPEGPEKRKLNTWLVFWGRILCQEGIPCH